jgi:hypothetical protein
MRVLGTCIVDTSKQAPAAEDPVFSPVAQGVLMPIKDTVSALQGATPSIPDAHGHAALLLVESLIHGSLSRSIISTCEALEVVECANDVQVEVAEAADGHGARMWQSHALLTAIVDSLKGDLEDDTNPVPLTP